MKTNPYETPWSPTAGNHPPASRFAVPLWWYTAIGWAELAVVVSAAASIVHDGGVTLLLQYMYLLGPLLTSVVLALAFASLQWVRLINALVNLANVLGQFRLQPRAGSLATIRKERGRFSHRCDARMQLTSTPL